VDKYLLMAVTVDYLKLGNSFAVSCPQRWQSVVAATSGTSTTAKERWQLMSAVCLERLPVITQDMNPTEKEMSGLYRQMDYEYSCLSDHELRHAEDL
jgi:hypothetical protein